MAPCGFQEGNRNIDICHDEHDLHFGEGGAMVMMMLMTMVVMMTMITVVML